MTKVSRIPTKTTRLNYFSHNLESAITMLESKDQVAEFLRDILTHTEYKMMAKRLQIAKMLLEGYDYKSIKGYVHVTDSTVSSISNKLGTSGKGLKQAIKKLQQIERKLDEKRMIGKSMQERYPTYYLPELIFNEVSKRIEKYRKLKSATKHI